MTISSSSGLVYIIGAGPGDPTLLTLRGKQCLEQADCILYDALIDSRLLDWAPAHAVRINVGKRGGKPSHSQQSINQLLIDHAQQGLCVVRLKGGDPFVFGRGAEEAIALNERDIPFEIIPGISAACGVTAYAGIPLTHRGLASTAVLVTGHEDPEKEDSTVDWPAIAQIDATIIIFMGASKINTICQTLVGHGKSAHTPAAIIESGTTSTQRELISTLEELPLLAENVKITAPALIVVGPAVSVNKRLNCRPNRPLQGQRILVTRRKEQAIKLQDHLSNAGAEVYNIPLIKLLPPSDQSAMNSAVNSLSTYDWLLFSSANAVHFFFRYLNSQGLDTRALSPVNIAAIGPVTASAINSFGINPDLIADESTQEGIIAKFKDIPVTGKNILFPTSDVGRSLIAKELTQRGAQINQLVAYITDAPKKSDLIIPEVVVKGLMDWMIFASPSSIRNLFKVFPKKMCEKLFANARVACLGPTTAQTAIEYGITVDVQPNDYDVIALTEALCNYNKSNS